MSTPFSYNSPNFTSTPRPQLSREVSRLSTKEDMTTVSLPKIMSGRNGDAVRLGWERNYAAGPLNGPPQWRILLIKVDQEQELLWSRFWIIYCDTCTGFRYVTHAAFQRWTEPSSYVRYMADGSARMARMINGLHFRLPEAGVTQLYLVKH
jgi:hypothetical protein